MSDAELICELPRVQELVAAWDALAAINAAPESAPHGCSAGGVT